MSKQDELRRRLPGMVDLLAHVLSVLIEEIETAESIEQVKSSKAFIAAMRARSRLDDYLREAVNEDDRLTRR